MNLTSTPLAHGIDEFEHASLEKAPSVMVVPPRVAASPASLECRVIQLIRVEPEFPGETLSTIVLGRVVGLHIRDGYLDAEGRFDTVKAQPTTRLGGFQYATVGEVIEMRSPFRRAG